MILLGIVGFIVFVVMAILFREVVPTNYVHIVQSTNKTTSYGKDQKAGNTYYHWPAWVPRFGVKVIKLPVSVFDIELSDYAAYDKERVPFLVDIMAFFRIDDSNMAAQRVADFDELQQQLEGILQGATRSILAKAEIENILEERAAYGLAFTEAVTDQLKAWGVANVKNIELMDIRDAKDSHVIANIMAKKQSLIEKESRVAVAGNIQAAREAEINAERAVQVRAQEAAESIGIRTAEKTRKVGIADQESLQAIKEQEKATAEKAMAVAKVNQVRLAEITKEVELVKAEQEKQVNITVSAGQLEAAKLHAEGVQVEGIAKGEAEKAVLLAPVAAQITLAEKIAELPAYQQYLVQIRAIEKDELVGKAQAEALKEADIKVIANTGEPAKGVSDVMGLFTSKGGTQIGSMLEAFKQTPAGEQVMKALSNGHAA
jgi:flotillin